jgi:hypothetical protein
MRTSMLSLFAAGLMLIAGTLTFAQEPPSEAEMQAMWERAMMLAQPGPEHEELARYTGVWNMEVKHWSTPGAEPVAYAGVSESRMILGGRFLESTWTSGEGEMAMEGISIMGFDRRHEEYTVIGLDTWGTYWVAAQGPYDEATKTITMYGEDNDPVFGMVQQYDFRMTEVDDDTFKWEVIFYNPEHTQGRDEHKMVEILYTRQK